MKYQALAALFLICMLGCEEDVLPEPNLERMIAQERYAPYETSPFFDDGKVMRRPPEGTVAREHITAAPAFTEGVVRGAYVDRIPLALSRDMLQLGRARFEVHCAACHGVLGDGVSIVASKMTLRKPPNLLSDKLRSFPPGRVFQVISEGYGLMPSYAHALTLEDRWAVVAYLRSLQKSRAIALDELPEDLGARARKELE